VAGLAGAGRRRVRGRIRGAGLLGMWSPWARAGEAQVQGALEALRTSRFATARQIHQLLSTLATWS